MPDVAKIDNRKRTRSSALRCGAAARRRPAGGRRLRPPVMRVDGGQGLVCNLGRRRGAARLFYRLLPDGKIALDPVRNHEAIGQCG